MSKPFVNLDEVEFTDVEDNGCYTSRRAQFSAGIGARRLGYNLTVLPPGTPRLWKMFRAEADVEYYDREEA